MKGTNKDNFKHSEPPHSSYAAWKNVFWANDCHKISGFKFSLVVLVIFKDRAIVFHFYFRISKITGHKYSINIHTYTHTLKENIYFK